MNPLRLLPGFVADEGRSTIFDDLRSGRAGFLVRLGLSVAAAPILVAVFLFALATIELSGGNIDEEHIAVAIGLSGAIWCGVLIWIWSGFRRFARLIKSAFVVIGTWVIAVPTCFFIAESFVPGDADDLLIAAVLLTAISITIYVATTAVYQSIGGKPLKDRIGDLRVQCPSCGYSMVGLDACRCPECGTSFTIDEIIIAQDYEALRLTDSVVNEGHAARTPARGDEPPRMIESSRSRESDRGALGNRGREPDASAEPPVRPEIA